MKRFELEGSLKQPQVVGLPGLVQGTGTDVNEAACPFDLESPVMVWKTGLRSTVPLSYWAPFYEVQLDETSACIRRDHYLKQVPYAVAIFREPFSQPLVEVCQEARSEGYTLIEVWSPHRVDRYPL